MKIMAIDLGLARTGLAICDKCELLASPLCVIHEKDRDKLLSIIVEKSKDLEVEEFVIGLPKNMDGTLGKSAEDVCAFSKDLSNLSGINVNLHDERTTTLLASRYLNTTNTRGKKRKDIIDAVSATIILQSFLDLRKNSGFPS